MECHIEQVLYRDQRTIKTRYFKDSAQDHHPPCLSCRQRHLKPPLCAENRRFHLLKSSPNHYHHHHQDSPCSNCDGAFTIHSDGPISSLDNCHNQYCLKLKRLLNRTEDQCRCEDVSYSRISEGRRRGMAAWIKKLQNVLLLSTYLLLLTLPDTHAQPTRTSEEMCSRPNNDTPRFWVSLCGSSFEPSGEIPNELNITSLNATINSANSAMISAIYLKDKYRNHTIDHMGSDPEKHYSEYSYSWLPQLPEISEEHLNSLQWQDSLLTMFKHLQTISVPLEQLILDFRETPFKDNFAEMEGRVTNVLCDLHDTLYDNNVKVAEHVERNIMPDSFRKVCSKKTERSERDWIVLRELVHVLEYTLATCKHLAEGRIEGNHTA